MYRSGSGPVPSTCVPRRNGSGNVATIVRSAKSSQIRRSIRATIIRVSEPCPVTHSPFDALRERLAGIDLTPSAAIDRAYLHDWVVPMAFGAALALAKPRTTQEVSSVLAACHALGLPVVPQGGRTGLAGGATPVDGAVILSLERMSGVLEIDSAAATLIAFAGTPLEAIQQAAREAGWFFALDFGARGS